MQTYLDKVLYLRNGEGPGIEFSQPYLNNDKELIFNNCSLNRELSNAHFVLNEEKKAIEIRGYAKKAFLLLDNDNISLYNEMIEMKKMILNNIQKFSKQMEIGSEKIYVFKSGESYYFTTPTLLDNTKFSIKFTKGLEYWLKRYIELSGKKITLNSYSDLQEYLSKAFINVDKTNYVKSTWNEFVYYDLSLNDLLEVV